MAHMNISNEFIKAEKPHILKVTIELDGEKLGSCSLTSDNDIEINRENLESAFNGACKVIYYASLNDEQ